MPGLKYGPMLAGMLAAGSFIALCFMLGVLLTAAFAREQYAGQFDNLDPATRSWFKSVRSPHGVPCCDIADGHLTDFTVDAEGHYHVEIEGESVLVPPEAVILNVGNPYEKAVVWYVPQGPGVDGKPIFYVRCFVPAGGV